MRKTVVAGLVCLAALAGGERNAAALNLFGLHLGPRSEQSMPQNMPSQTPENIKPTQVQSSDAEVRLQQLEDQVRQLNGRVEDMSFQLLKMQEDMRKTQQDQEFRFQQLEKGGGGTRAPSGNSNGGTTTFGGGSMKKSEATPPADQSGGQDNVASIIDQSGGDQTPSAGSDQADSGRGAPPSQLGSIQFDQNGNPVGANANSQLDNGSGPAPMRGSNTNVGNTGGGTQTASLGNESDSYKAAYNHVLAGDYGVAEQEFRQFITSYPNSSRSADANFWLGESLYSQGKFNDAAKTFLNAHQKFGTSEKAPDMLLKLGMSLAALDNKDTACATLHEVTKRYPKASKAVATKVASEEKRLAC